MNGSPRHLDALTGIRGIAAWGVVLYHIRLSLTALLPPPVIAIFAKGYLAVDLFFILSGFVIWYNYSSRIAEGGAGAARLFLWRRFARVWPLHGAILGGFVALAMAMLATGRDASGYPLAELPLHLALLQNWGLTDALSWNHPAWSISTEFSAYLVFPLLVLVTRWDRVPSGVLLGLAGLWRCLAGFAMGCLMCQLWQRWRDAALGGLLAALGCASIIAGAFVFDLPETAWVPAALFAGLLALALGRGPIVKQLGGKVVTYLGEISYATYLGHYGLFILFKLAFVDAALQLSWGGLAGYLALVMAASVTFYHGLEKPAQRWLNARPPRWAARVQAAPAE